MAHWEHQRPRLRRQDRESPWDPAMRSNRPELTKDRRRRGERNCRMPSHFLPQNICPLVSAADADSSFLTPRHLYRRSGGHVRPAVTNCLAPHSGRGVRHRHGPPHRGCPSTRCGKRCLRGAGGCSTLFRTRRTSPQLPGSQPSDHDPWNAPDPILRESAHR